MGACTHVTFCVQRFECLKIKNPLAAVAPLLISGLTEVSRQENDGKNDRGEN